MNNKDIEVIRNPLSLLNYTKVLGPDTDFYQTRGLYYIDLETITK